MLLALPVSLLLLALTGCSWLHQAPSAVQSGPKNPFKDTTTAVNKTAPRSVPLPAKLYKNPEALVGKPFRDLGEVYGSTCKVSLQDPPPSISAARRCWMLSAGHLPGDRAQRLAMTSTFGFRQIGVILSPYKEKFAGPRQPGLVADGVGELHLLPPYNQAEAVRGLTEFRHIWLLFVFHQTPEGGWRPTVSPPRLGGNSRIGVFATRSPFRPNPIGMSLVALEGITLRGADVILRLGSLDLMDGTPVVDIKPYLHYAESLAVARPGFAQSAPDDILQVIFSPQAELQLRAQAYDWPRLREFICDVLAQDLRPAYHRRAMQARDYAVALLDFNVCGA